MKLSGHQQVLAFLDQLEHPQKAEIEEVRRIILGAEEGIEEQIKWKAPSFCYNGDDRITFNLHGKGYFLLIFHCGAKSKGAGKTPLLDDATGLLEWVAGDRATVKFTSMEDVLAKKQRLTDAVREWIKVTAVGENPSPS